MRWGGGGDGGSSSAPFGAAVGAAAEALRTMCASCAALGPGGAGASLPAITRREPALSPEAWAGAVDAVLAGIERGDHSKVVLAQRLRLQLTAGLDPVHVLLRLHAASPAAPPAASATPAAASATASAGSAAASAAAARRHSYLFLLQPNAEVAFVGCTPESLFRVHDGGLSTEAIAGTRRRGATAEEDAALCAELLSSTKDRLELDAVCEMLQVLLPPPPTHALAPQSIAPFGCL